MSRGAEYIFKPSSEPVHMHTCTHIQMNTFNRARKNGVMEANMEEMYEMAALKEMSPADFSL